MTVSDTVLKSERAGTRGGPAMLGVMTFLCGKAWRFDQLHQAFPPGWTAVALKLHAGNVCELRKHVKIQRLTETLLRDQLGSKHWTKRPMTGLPD
jgi:hypothetical protein